eukprot:gene6480-261_t
MESSLFDDDDGDEWLQSKVPTRRSSVTTPAEIPAEPSRAPKTPEQAGAGLAKASPAGINIDDDYFNSPAVVKGARQSAPQQQGSPSSQVSEDPAVPETAQLARTHAFCRCIYLGTGDVDAPSSRAELGRLMKALKKKKSGTPPSNVLLCIPRLSGGGQIVLASADGETVLATHNVKKILFCAKGDTTESTCVAFTTHHQVASDEMKDIFRCQVFYFADAGSTEHSLQCLAQAFGNIQSQTGPGRSTGDALTYLFDFQVIVREGEIAKGSMQGCPTAKSVFKLRAGYEKEITVTITQSSKQQMILQAAVGLLIGDGGADSDTLKAVELTSAPNSIGKSFVVSGNWMSPILEHETPKDAQNLQFTIAVDVHIAGLSEILRLKRTIAARVYKSSERFLSWKQVKGGKNISMATLEVKLVGESNKSTGEVDFKVLSIEEKEAEVKKGYIKRLNKYLIPGGNNSAGAGSAVQHSGSADGAADEDEDEDDEEDEMMDINLSGTGVVEREIEDQKLEAWADALSRWDDIPDAKLKKLTRKGIPDALRDQVWRRLVSTGLADADLIQNFPRLVQKESTTEQVIMWDLTRTFPGNEFFQEAGGTGQTRLYNICKAYSVYDEQVGYCQGLSFVAAELLLHMPEEDAFCLFIKIMYDYKVRDMFKNGFAQMQVKYYQLTRLIQVHIPDLFAHFRELNIEVHMFCTQWFLTIFGTKFPLSTAYHVLDVFLSEGPLVLFNIALGLLKLGKRYLLQFDFEGVMNFFRVDLPRMFPDERSACKLISVGMKMKVSEKMLDKYEAEFLIQKAEDEMANDPLTRATEENASLKGDVQRLEAENESLANVLVTDKIEMQQKISTLDVALNSATREVARLKALLERVASEAEEDKTRLESEATQLKSMYRATVNESDGDRSDLVAKLQAAQRQLKEATARFQAEKDGHLKIIRENQARAVLSDHDVDQVELQAKVSDLELELAKQRGLFQEGQTKNELLEQKLKAAAADLQTLRGGRGSGSSGGGKWFNR